MSEFFLTKKIEILLVRYQEHAAHIRHLDNFDVRIFGGFISIQLALAGWFATHSIDGVFAKFGLSLVNFSLLLACLMILRGSHKRRKEVVQVIWNISEALGLDRVGTYLPNKAINPQHHVRQFWWYEIGTCFGFMGTMFVLWFSPSPTPSIASINL